MAFVQPSSAESEPFSTSRTTFSTAWRTGPFFVPRYCGWSAAAVSEKIVPTGASEKNGFVKPARAGSV